jgi:hypothetical protein
MRRPGGVVLPGQETPAVASARMQQLLAEEVAAEGAPQDLPHSHPH